MQRAEDSSSRLAPEPASPRPAVKPTTAFLLLLLLLAVVGAAIYLTRPTPAPVPTGTTSAPAADFSLTNEEAIARFQELASVRRQAYADHDITLLATLYTHDSRVASLAMKELRRLNRDRVSDLSMYETLQVDVLSNRPDSIKMREVVLVTPKFVDNHGKDITVNSEVTQETVVWTLHLEDDAWRVYDALITKSSVVRSR